MQHPDEGTIHSWLDGALSADEAARVEAHVKECSQCAAAVAEARGFIAGASRILTALDNAPRGVIPVAAPRKRIDPLMWRVAATLLVIATGTLVVFRNGGREAENATTNADTARNTTAPGALTAVTPAAPGDVDLIRTTPEPAPPIRIQAQSSRPAPLGSSQPSVGSTEKRVAKGAAVDTLTAAQGLAALAPQAAYSGKALSAAPQSNIPARENKAVTDQRNPAVSGNISTSSGYAGAAAASQTSAPPTAAQNLRSRGAIALDATSEQLPLKVVGTPRTLGAKVTLYEVAPGDTVTLREELNVRLEAVVVTRASTAPQARRSTEKSAAAAQTQRADTTVVSAADSQRSVGAAGALARTPSAPAPIARVEVADGETTIRWVDATTGNVLRLSGRMPEARLQQVKTRLERERAAAAAAKKNP